MLCPRIAALTFAERKATKLTALDVSPPVRLTAAALTSDGSRRIASNRNPKVGGIWLAPFHFKEGRFLVGGTQTILVPAETGTGVPGLNRLHQPQPGGQRFSHNHRCRFLVQFSS